MYVAQGFSPAPGADPKGLRYVLMKGALARGAPVGFDQIALDVEVTAAADRLERALPDEPPDGARREAEHRRGAEDGDRCREQRDPFDLITAVQFGAEHRGFGLGE